MDMTRFTQVRQVVITASGAETPFVIERGIGAIVVQGRAAVIPIAYRAGDIAAGNYFSAPIVGTGKPYSRGFINNRERTIYFGAGVVEIELWS
jgi:hypothetical protein